LEHDRKADVSDATEEGHMLSRRLFLSVVAGASFGIPASAGASQRYPQRPVKRPVEPFSFGSASGFVCVREQFCSYGWL